MDGAFPLDTAEGKERRKEKKRKEKKRKERAKKLLISREKPVYPDWKNSHIPIGKKEGKI